VHNKFYLFSKQAVKLLLIRGFLYEKVLIMILFNDKMYSKVIIIIKKGWCMSMVYALVAGTVAVYAVIAKYVLNGVGTAK
jgi:hypothetical protein